MISKEGEGNTDSRSTCCPFPWRSMEREAVAMVVAVADMKDVVSGGISSVRDTLVVEVVEERRRASAMEQDEDGKGFLDDGREEEREEGTKER